jgi:hypothetical protein
MSKLIFDRQVVRNLRLADGGKRYKTDKISFPVSPARRAGRFIFCLTVLDKIPEGLTSSLA